MSIRELLLNQLKDAINERENTSLSLEQITHYIGSDMPTCKLKQWVEDTVYNVDPVCSDDVLSLCEGMDIA